MESESLNMCSYPGGNCCGGGVNPILVVLYLLYSKVVSTYVSWLVNLPPNIPPSEIKV